MPLLWSALALWKGGKARDGAMERIRGQAAAWLKAQGAGNVEPKGAAVEFTHERVAYSLSVVGEPTAGGIGFLLSTSEPDPSARIWGLIIPAPAVIFALLATYVLASYFPWLRSDTGAYAGVFFGAVAVVFFPTVLMMQDIGLLENVLSPNRGRKAGSSWMSGQVLGFVETQSKKEGLDWQGKF